MKICHKFGGVNSNETYVFSSLTTIRQPNRASCWTGVRKKTCSRIVITPFTLQVAHYPTFAVYMGNLLRKFPMTQVELIRRRFAIIYVRPSGFVNYLLIKKPENALWFHSLAALTELAVGLGSRNPIPIMIGNSPPGLSQAFIGSSAFF
jgi:hypothetical protein